MDPKPKEPGIKNVGVCSGEWCEKWGTIFRNVLFTIELAQRAIRTVAIIPSLLKSRYFRTKGAPQFLELRAVIHVFDVRELGS